MAYESLMLTSSALIMLILLALLIALALRLNSPPKSKKKVSSDLKKIKEQINGE